MIQAITNKELSKKKSARTTQEEPKKKEQLKSNQERHWRGEWEQWEKALNIKEHVERKETGWKKRDGNRQEKG